MGYFLVLFCVISGIDLKFASKEVWLKKPQVENLHLIGPSFHVKLPDKEIGIVMIVQPFEK